MRYLPLTLTLSFLSACQGSGQLTIVDDEPIEEGTVEEAPADTTPETEDEEKDPTEPTDDEEPEEAECIEWSEVMTFDTEIQSTVDYRVSEVTLANGITLFSQYGLWFQDDCFGIPDDGDIALCVRGSGNQPEDVDEYDNTIFGGGLLEIHIPDELEANWLTLIGCDFADDNMLVEAEAADGTELHSEEVPATGENLCHTDLQIGWYDFEEKAIVFILSVDNAPNHAEAWALNQLAVGFDCETGL